MILSRGTAGSSSTGVKVELRAGRSQIGSWRFAPSGEEERVLIGAAADCNWQVTAPAVVDHHVELMWVGDTLWVSAASREAEVWVDGAPVDAWTPIEWDTEIMFGGAELAVFGAARHEAQTVISSVEPMSATRPPTSVPTRPPSQVPTIETNLEEPTENRPALPTHDPAPTAPHPRVEAPTRVARPPQRPQPRVEPHRPQVAPPLVEEVRTIAPTETIIDPMPPTAPTRPPETTAFTDLSSLQRWAARSEDHIDEPTHQVVVAPPAAPDPEPVAPPPAAAPAPAPLTAPPALLSVEPLAPTAEPALPPVVSDRLAAPPPRVAPTPVAPSEPLLDRALEMVHRIREAIPSQVMIGGAIAIAIVIGLLVLDRIGTTREDAHAAHSPAQMVVPTPTAAPIPQVVRNDEPPIDPEQLAHQEAQAARLVAAGQLVEALPIYEQLAAASTDNQAYAIAAKVLRQQIADRCKNTPGGPGCPATP